MCEASTPGAAESSTEGRKMGSEARPADPEPSRRSRLRRIAAAVVGLAVVAAVFGALREQFADYSEDGAYVQALTTSALAGLDTAKVPNSATSAQSWSGAL